MNKYEYIDITLQIRITYQSINIVGLCQLDEWKNFLSIDTYQYVCQSIEDQRILSSSLLLFER